MDTVPKLSKKLRSQLLKKSKWKLSLIGCAVTLAIALLAAAILLLTLRRGKDSCAHRTNVSIVLKLTEADEKNAENDQASTRTDPTSPPIKRKTKAENDDFAARPSKVYYLSDATIRPARKSASTLEGQRSRPTTIIGRVAVVAESNNFLKEAENQLAIANYDNKRSTQHTFKLLHFEEDGDIGRVIVQRERSTAVISVEEGVAVGESEEAYIFLQPNRTRGVLVDVRNDRVSVLSSPTPVEESHSFTMRKIYMSPLGAWNSSGFTNIIQIASGPNLPLALTRMGPNGENITIQTNAHTTVIERRHSGDAKLLLRKRNSPSAADAPQTEEETLWEEMVIRPQMLNVSAVNSHGTLDFQNEKAVHIVSHREGNVSGSPFRHKFARMSNENGTIEVDYLGDNHGKGRLTNRRAGTELWWRPLPFRAGTKDARNRTLSLEEGRYVYNSEETLDIDLKQESVVVSNATEETGGESVRGRRRRTWSAPFARVEMQKSESGKSSWGVWTAEGVVFNVSEHGEFQLRTAAGDVVHSLEDDCYANGTMGAVSMKRDYDAEIFKAGAAIRVKLDDSNFDIRADAGSVVIANKMATIAGLAATISFTPCVT